MSSEIPVQIDSEKLVAHTMKITANWREHAKVATDKSIFDYFNKRLEVVRHDIER